MMARRLAVILFVSAIASPAAMAQTRFEDSKPYRRAMKRMGKAYAKARWLKVLDSAVPVLEVKPTDPATLKLCGIALQRLSRPALAHAALSASGLQQSDADVKAAIEQVSSKFGTVVVRYHGAPPEIFEGYRPNNAELAGPLVPLAGRGGGSDNSKATKAKTRKAAERTIAKVAQYLRGAPAEIDGLGGKKKKKRKKRKKGAANVVTVTYRQVVAPPSSNLALSWFRPMSGYGYEDLRLPIALEAGETAEVVVDAFRKLARILLPSVVDGDQVRIDGQVVSVKGGEVLVPVGPVPDGKRQLELVVIRSKVLWTQRVEVSPGATALVEHAWALAAIKGLKAQDKVRVDGVRTGGSNPIDVPPGRHRIEVRRSGAKAYTFERTFEAGKRIELKMPIFLRASTDTDDDLVLVVDSGAAKKPKKGESTPVASDAREVTVHTGRHEPHTRGIKGEPGSELDLRIKEADLALLPAWRDYHERPQVRGWAWTALGVGAAITGGAAFVLLKSRSARSGADSALGNYQAALTLEEAQKYRTETDDLDEEADGFQMYGMAAGAVGAAFIGWGTYRLLSHPTLGRPERVYPAKAPVKVSVGLAPDAVVGRLQW